MKKFLSLLICFMIVLSNATIIASAEDAQSAEKLLTDYFNNHKSELFPETNGEIEEAFLADIDNDGEPELLATPGAYWYGLFVYKVKDGKVVQLPEAITFGRGTGINENYGFLMADNGHMYIYRDSLDAQVPWEKNVITQVVYDRTENTLTPISYLQVIIPLEETGITPSYTTDFNAGIDPIEERMPEAEQIKTTSAEAEAMVSEFKDRVSPYIIWTRDELWGDEASDRNRDLDRYWNVQKERQAASKKIEAEASVTLQIGNSLMVVDGKSKEIDEGKESPVIKEGRTLIPVGVVEEMGGTVSWDESSSAVTLTYSENTIKLVIGSNTAHLNDTPKTLDVAPEIINGKTMLPIRFIAESFGFNVRWEAITEQIFITK